MTNFKVWVSTPANFRAIFRPMAMIFTIAFGLIYGNTSHARSPDYCVGYKNLLFVNLGEYTKVAPPGKAPVDLDSCADFKSFDDLGGEINALFNFSNPHSNIIVVPHMLDAKDNYAFDHIEISIDHQVQDQTYVDAIFVHEWSHGILSRYLQENLEILRPMRAWLSDYDKQTRVLPELVALFDVDGQCTSSACIRFAQQNADLLGDQSFTNKVNHYFDTDPGYLLLFQLSGAYQELFADFVPALYYSDLEIIRTSLLHFLTPKDMKQVDCRSFSLVPPTGYRDPDVHCSLWSVRHVLGLKMAKAQNEDAKKALARKFLILISEQIREQVARVASWTPAQLAQFPDATAIHDLSVAIDKL